MFHLFFESYFSILLKKVVPQTHKKHTEICERIAWPKNLEYIPIPKKDRFFDDYRSTGGVLVHYKAGDLVLWDSRLVIPILNGLCTSQSPFCCTIEHGIYRTVHCNAPSIEPTVNPKDGSPWLSEGEKANMKWDMIRMVAYICSSE